MTTLYRFLNRRGRWLVILLLWLFWGRMLHAAAVKSDTFDEMFHLMYGVLYWQHSPLEPVVQNPPLVDALIGLPVSLVLHPTLPLEHPTWPTGNWLRIAQAFLWEINPNGLQILWVGRFATMSLALLLGALLYRWGRELGQSSVVGLLALFLCSFDPNILAHSTLATGDLGMTFFLCWAAYGVWRYWRGRDGTRGNSGELVGTQEAVSREPLAVSKKLPAALSPQYSVLTPYLLAAAGIGCVLAAKFSGLVFLPAVSLMAGYRWWLGRTVQPSEGLWRESAPGKKPSEGYRGLLTAAAELLGWFLLATLLFLLIYRFDLATLTADFVRQREHQLAGHSTFLLGQLSIEGWWYYFPLVFAIKTPLPVLILLAAALLSFIIHRRYDWNPLWLLLVAAGIGGASLISRVNIGYRYLLPALPLLYLFIAQWLGRRETRDFQRTTHHALRIPSFILHPSSFILLLWLTLDSLLIHPDYLAYFNPLGGGPESGWRVVVDSNIDWGQDIKPLGRFLTENGITESVNVAWLGTGPLSAYGVKGIPLPAWPNASEEMLYSPFYPPRPAPGLYVLSVTQLQGVYLSDPTRFAWFQAQTPNDKVGYSLFVYDVPTDGPAVGVALSGVGLADVALGDFEQMVEGNDTRPRWFDARSAFLWPGGTAGSTWAVVGEGHMPVHPLLRALYPVPTLSGEGQNDRRYRVFAWDASPIRQAVASRSFYTDFGYAAAAVVGAADWDSQRQPLLGAALFGDTFELLGYSMSEEQTGLLTLMTTWRIHQAFPINQPDNLKIFIHLLNAEGEVVTQYDGLDAHLAGLQPGDELAQLHQLTLPPDLPPGPYALQMGLYDVETGIRLSIPTPVGLVDRLLLHRFSFN